MLNPKYEKYANRLRELIDEGGKVAKLEKPSQDSSVKHFQGEDKGQVISWLTKSRNILEITFGLQSPHVRHFDALVPKYGLDHINSSHNVYLFSEDLVNEFVQSHFRGIII